MVALPPRLTDHPEEAVPTAAAPDGEGAHDDDDDDDDVDDDNDDDDDDNDVDNEDAEEEEKKKPNGKKDCGKLPSEVAQNEVNQRREASAAILGSRKRNQEPLSKTCPQQLLSSLRPTIVTDNIASSGEPTHVK
jgi:hypothetical protein